LKVAVSINNSGIVAPHLGRAKMFFIFNKTKDEVRFLEKRLCTGQYHDHIIEDIKDCQAVISGKIGDGMAENLRKVGIQSFVIKDISNPKEAVEKIRE